MEKIRILTKHTKFVCLLLGICLTFTLPIFAKNASFDYEQFRTQMHAQGLFDTTVMVPMRDGVNLSTIIYKSPVGGPYPAIVIRTPYGKTDSSLSALQVIILTGYALVIQDTRGRYASEGEKTIFITDGWGEQQDGYDTIEWVAKQSWCDGKIGTWGPSALGITQIMTARAVPPHLVCQAIGFASAKFYGQLMYQDGVFRKELVEGWLNDINLSSLLTEYLAHPTYDDFWKQWDIETKNDVVNVPTMFVGGWYDCFGQGTLDEFVIRQEQGQSGARGKQKLIMGPWTHTNEAEQKQGQLTYPSTSTYDAELDDTLNWFDYWLKGKSNGVMDEPVVKYYLMGDVSDAKASGNVWKTGTSWPPASQAVSLYLGSSGLLSTAMSSENSVLPLSMNPSAPVPTSGGMNLDISAGPYDQKSIESRSDVLVFTTETLTQPVEITGRVQAVLYAESNLSDNDLTVRMTDVYPDGRSMLVCDGIARASFRESRSDPTPIEPGTVYRYDVDCWSTSLVFNTGHRIRIIVANTNSTRFDLNPVYKKLGQDGNPAESWTQLHFSPDYPSHLLLPVVSGLTGVRDWRKLD